MNKVEYKVEYEGPDKEWYPCYGNDVFLDPGEASRKAKSYQDRYPRRMLRISRGVWTIMHHVAPR